MSAPAADLSYVVLAGLSAFGCAAVAVGGGIGGGSWSHDVIIILVLGSYRCIVYAGLCGSDGRCPLGCSSV